MTVLLALCAWKAFAQHAPGDGLPPMGELSLQNDHQALLISHSEQRVMFMDVHSGQTIKIEKAGITTEGEPFGAMTSFGSVQAKIGGWVQHQREVYGRAHYLGELLPSKGPKIKIDMRGDR
jgi:hypothetical protein